MRALPLLSTLATLALASLGGCVFYGEDLKFGEDCGPNGPCEGDDWSDTGADTADADALVWTLSPNTMLAGETRILTLSAAPAFDYASIDEIQVFGDVGLLTFEPSANGLELVVEAAADAPAGVVDLLLLTVDGEGVWLEDALSVGASDEGAGDEGSGDEGSGGATDPGDSGSGCG